MMKEKGMPLFAVGDLFIFSGACLLRRPGREPFRCADTADVRHGFAEVEEEEEG